MKALFLILSFALLCGCSDSEADKRREARIAADRLAAPGKITATLEKAALIEISRNASSFGGIVVYAKDAQDRFFQLSFHDDGQLYSMKGVTTK
jgi:hypothetical protein